MIDQLHWLRRESPKGFCIAFVKKGTCKTDNCKYKHQAGGEVASLSLAVEPVALPRLESQGYASVTSKAAVTEERTASSCTPASLAPQRPPTRKGVREEAVGLKAACNSKGFEGSCRRCLSPSAMLAGATPQADAFTFRKCQNNMCHSMTSQAVPAFSFHETPYYINILIRDPSCDFLTVRKPMRKYDKEFSVDFKPTSSDDSLRDAITSARRLKATIDASYDGSQPNATMSLIPRLVAIIAVRASQGSERPINILTANGPALLKTSALSKYPPSHPRLNLMFFLRRLQSYL